MAAEKAYVLDKLLNESRRAARIRADVQTLPDGVFVTLGDNDFRLLWDGALHRWSPERYRDPVPMEDFRNQHVEVLTPALSARALRGGYPVEVHPSAGPWR